MVCAEGQSREGEATGLHPQPRMKFLGRLNRPTLSGKCKPTEGTDARR